MNASISEILQVIVSGTGALLAIRPMINADKSFVTVIREGYYGDRLIFADWMRGKTRTTFWIQVILFLGGLALLRLAPPPWVVDIMIATQSPDAQMIQRQLSREAQVSQVVSRLLLTFVSLSLMRLSYKSWINIPRLSRQRSGDGGRTTTDSIGASGIHPFKDTEPRS